MRNDNLRDKQDLGNIAVTHVPGKDEPADMFTKPLLPRPALKKKNFVNSLESNQPRSKQFFFNGLWMKINFRSCMERLNQSYNTKYLTCTLECLILSILSLNLPYQSIQLIKLKIHLTHTLRANKIPKHNVMTSIQRTLQCAKHFSHVSTI